MLGTLFSCNLCQTITWFFYNTFCYTDDGEIYVSVHAFVAFSVQRAVELQGGGFKYLS